MNEEKPVREKPVEEITVYQAAELVNRTPGNIYKAAREGKFRSRVVQTVGAKSEYRIDKESFDEWRRSIKRTDSRDNEWQGRSVRVVATA